MAKQKNAKVVVKDNLKTNTNSMKELAEASNRVAEAVRHQQSEMMKLTTTLRTDIVEDETVDGFLNQISNNIMVGIKAVYYVCRDLYHAEKILTEDDFDYLVSLLKTHYSRATVEKYIAIGKSERLAELYSQGRLPSAWTTQHAIAIMSEEDWELIRDIITSDTTMKEINEVLGKVSIPNETWRTSAFDKSTTIGLVNVKSKTEDARLMYQLSDEIRNVVKKFNAKQLAKYETSSNGKDLNDKFEVEFKFDTEFMNKIENKTINFIKKMKTGKRNEKKEKIANVRTKGELATA